MKYKSRLAEKAADPIVVKAKADTKQKWDDNDTLEKYLAKKLKKFPKDDEKKESITEGRDLPSSLRHEIDDSYRHNETKCAYGHQDAAKRVARDLADLPSLNRDVHSVGNEFDLRQEVESYLDDVCKFMGESIKEWGPEDGPSASDADDDGEPDWKGQSMMCRKCGSKKKIVSASVGGGSGPTEVYKLACGHTEM
jgi:hypothetical protein